MGQDIRTKNALGQALQNLSGKDIKGEDYTTTLEMLNAFNAMYACVVTFAVTPSGSTIVVKKGTTVIAPEEDGTYLLKEGAYTYTASKPYYITKADQALTITNADETTGTKTVTVTLTAVTPALVSAVAILDDDTEVPIVDNALTLIQNSVLDRVEAVVNVPVTLNGTPSTLIELSEEWFTHGTITVDAEDPTKVIVTPNGTNGQTPLLGVFSIKVPADSVRNATVGNAEVIITLTVEAEAA